MCTNSTQVPCEVPSLPNPTTRKGWPHHRGLRPLLFSNSDVGSFTSHKNKSVKVQWDGTYGSSSLSEKTRKSNHLQISLQRQHFLLSYFKTLSVGPAGVWTRDLPLGRPALPTELTRQWICFNQQFKASLEQYFMLLKDNMHRSLNSAISCEFLNSNTVLTFKNVIECLYCFSVFSQWTSHYKMQPYLLTSPFYSFCWSSSPLQHLPSKSNMI